MLQLARVGGCASLNFTRDLVFVHVQTDFTTFLNNLNTAREILGLPIFDKRGVLFEGRHAFFSGDASESLGTFVSDHGIFLLISQYHG